MRVPEGYEEMIREIARVAAKNRYHYEKDRLEDMPPCLPGQGHLFRINVYLSRNNDDFLEDAPILV